MKLLCIDTETTGLDPNTCDIIELGFALYDTDVAGHTPVFMDSFLVTPKERINEEVQSVTGINQRMIDEYAIQPDEAACRLNAVLAHAPHFIVGHNIIRYDAPILRRYLELISDADAVASHPPLIDTMYDLPHKKTPKSNSLTYLCADVAKFVNPFPHRALFDVLSTMKLLFTYDVGAVAANALSPFVVIRADVSFANKDLARAAGYNWDADKRIWFKMIRNSRLEEEKAKATFPVLLLETQPIPRL